MGFQFILVLLVVLVAVVGGALAGYVMEQDREMGRFQDEYFRERLAKIQQRVAGRCGCTCHWQVGR